MQNLILLWIQAFATALIPSLFALALVWLRRHQINTRVIEAVGRAAGEAYKQMIQSAGTQPTGVSLAAAVSAGCDYLLARIPETLRAAEITPEGAAQMVSAELGRLLAIDPTVGVGRPLGAGAVGPSASAAMISPGPSSKPANAQTPAA